MSTDTKHEKNQPRIRSCEGSDDLGLVAVSEAMKPGLVPVSEATTTMHEDNQHNACMWFDTMKKANRSE